VTTFDEILTAARRPETTVSLCLRGDLVGPYRELERKLRTASRTQVNLAEPSEASLLAAQMRDIEAQMAAASHTFTLRAMTAHEWSDFLVTRPERDPETKEETFRAAWFDWTCQLVAVSCVDPQMTAEQVAQLCDVLSGGQWDELSNTAFGLNSREVTVPFSVAASALTQDDEQR